MTKTQKADIVKTLCEGFTNCKDGAIVVADYKGCSHKALESLRTNASEVDVNIQVVKNSLFNIALKESGFPELELNNSNIFIWGEDQIAVCKVADQFALSNKDTFIVKTGIVESEVAELSTINALAKLPGKEELLGMLASVWMGPVRNFTIGLDALRKKKEEAA